MTFGYYTIYIYIYIYIVRTYIILRAFIFVVFETNPIEKRSQRHRLLVGGMFNTFVLLILGIRSWEHTKIKNCWWNVSLEMIWHSYTLLLVLQSAEWFLTKSHLRPMPSLLYPMICHVFVFLLKSDSYAIKNFQKRPHKYLKNLKVYTYNM